VLRQEIVTGALTPGQVINEPDLAARYSVSKTPVREALRLLVHADWVVVLPRKGYLVKPLALGDIREIFALRRILEPPLAGEAARLATDEVVERFRALLAEQASSELDLDGVTAAMRQFHLLIAEVSGNRRAARIVSSLLDEVVRLIHLMPRLKANVRSLDELEAHEQIVEAIARRDAEDAEDLMRAHIVLGGRGVMQIFTESM
jgi:DNA-binding GntR family transcriptional regulator